MKFKNKRRIILNFLMLFCILLLLAIARQYQQKQHFLILESNKLLSNDYIEANLNINTIWKNKLKKTENIWILGLIENQEDVNVISIYATEFKDILFPIKEGEIFSENDNNEAIVGESVSTYDLNGNEFFRFQGKEYKVVGKLGVSKNSPLKMTALINDSRFLESEVIPLWFDGPDIYSLSWLEGVEGKYKGVERLFNITNISNYIMFTVWLIVICATILWIYHYNINSEIMRDVLIHIGVKNYNILIKELIYLLYIFFINIIIILVIINTNYILKEILQYYFILYLGVIILNTVMFFYQISRRTFNYD